MLRVGQMMFAEILKRHWFFKEWEVDAVSQENLKLVIHMFKDTDFNDFSI